MKTKIRQAALLGKRLAIWALILSMGNGLVLPGIYSYAAVNPLAVREDITQNEETNTAAVEKEWQILEIGSAEQLTEVAKKSTLDTWSVDKYVKLTGDISLTGSEFTYFSTFGGIFDGNGHTIDGMHIQSDMSYLGLFSKLQPGAVLKNLTVKGTVIPGKKQLVVGGIVGDNYGTIDHCTFEGTVKGNDYTGGIAGYNETTGIIINCTTKGTVIGQHYTGGIAGTNSGSIFGSVNQAKVNTTNVDKGMSLDDLNLDTYLGGIRSLGGDTSESKRLDTANNTVDTGGIVGYTFGVVEFCSNQGEVGYERVGYNVGGIAGRQSGYLYSCENKGKVLGRKDVGGIVGQAEPYVQLDLTEDIVNQLTDNINELHDLVGKTLEDSGNSSDTISNRLSLVQKFVDNALKDTSYISGETITFINGLTGAGNETLNRADYAMKEAGKEGGALDQTEAAMKQVNQAVDNLEKVTGDIDIYSYMTEEEQLRYEAARGRIADNSKEYNGYYGEVYQNNYYYYLKYKSEHAVSPKSYAGMGADIDRKLIAFDKDGNKLDSNGNDNTFPYGFPKSENITIANQISYIKHADDSPFPDTAEDEDKKKKDEDLIRDASADAESTSKAYANAQYAAAGHSATFEQDLKDDAQIMADIYSNHQDQMTEDARRDMDAALENLKAATDNASSAMSQTSAIVDNLAGRENISLPVLDDAFRNGTNSFVANMQGMSENLGVLNEEMASSTDDMLDDMSQVNDSFNRMMLLFTDAMDGVLDGEYADRFEDESLEAAAESTEGTVADCINYGTIAGDLDIAGIAGTMGIEYDFDLEGDVTGNKDAKLNSTFKTKCVLRGNKNEGRITAQKSYCGGITGLQEMGTILGAENYGRIASTTGDYVGGIAGNSVSAILNCYSKGIMSGDQYVGGIAGYGHQIYSSYAIPAVVEANSFVGAIAGEVDDEAKLKENYFVSDILAGIDRISYSRMAEPLTYEEFVKTEELPTEFQKMKITFLVEEEVVGTKTIDYGRSLDESQYPESITEEEYYIDWDTTMVHDLKTDMEIIGEPALYRTTIAGNVLRDNKQSAILVDGKFKSSQELEAKQYADSDSSKELGRFAERWKVQVPMDGQETHTFRVQLPEGVQKASIYVKTHGEYEKVETNTMGMYQLFDITGPKASIMIIDETVPTWVYILIAVAVLGILGMLLLWYRKKYPGKFSYKKKKQKVKEKTQQAKENRKEKLEMGIEKAQQLLKEAKDDSPRGNGPA